MRVLPVGAEARMIPRRLVDIHIGTLPIFVPRTPQVRGEQIDIRSFQSKTAAMNTLSLYNSKKFAADFAFSFDRMRGLSGFGVDSPAHAKKLKWSRQWSILFE